jgi:hypothetical protein
LFPFGSFYDEATREFPVASSVSTSSVSVEGGVGGGSSKGVVRPDYSVERSGSPGPFRNRGRGVEGRGLEEEGVMSLGRPSFIRSGSQLDLPSAVEEEEARVYWDGVLAQVNETGDEVLRNEKGKSSCLSPTSILPASKY